MMMSTLRADDNAYGDGLSSTEVGVLVQAVGVAALTRACKLKEGTRIPASNSDTAASNTIRRDLEAMPSRRAR